MSADPDDGRARYTNAQKARIVELTQEGFTPAEIAAEMGQDAARIKDWLRYRREDWQRNHGTLLNGKKPPAKPHALPGISKAQLMARR